MPTRIDRTSCSGAAAPRTAWELVEVLPAAEYEDEHLPGAIKISLKERDGHSVAGLVHVLQLPAAGPLPPLRFDP
jgi:rhodanese-related sulfurtransferase